MKLFLTVLTTLTISALLFLNADKTNKHNRILTDVVIFDGYEGNMYFFTNSLKEALTIEDNNSEVFEKYKLKSNDHVGKTFTLLFKLDQKSTNNYMPCSAVVDLKLQ